VTAADRYRIQLVRADAPVKNLRTAGLGIEVPLSALLDDRNRCGPILVANREDSAIRVMGIRFYLHFLLRHRGKCFPRVLVLHVISRRDEILARGSEDL